MRDRLAVYLEDRPTPRLVGELSDVGTGPHFQYDPGFLQHGVDLSPFTLPRGSQVFGPGPRGLHRLRGLFFDALPDGWGLKLLHRAMRQANIDAAGSSPVTWLRSLGSRGMGALTFRPPMDGVETTMPPAADLATLAAEARAVDGGSVDTVLPALTRAGGASGGARPKIVAGWHDSGTIVDAFTPLPAGYRPVLIKFASRTEPEDTPLVEAAYLSMAKTAGIEVPVHRTYALPENRWALIIDRFDRVLDQRLHVQTLAGLLEVDIRNDVVEYEQLIQVAHRLTKDYRAARACWTRAAFNVGAYNRDDHARNVAFRMTPDGSWTLAPAYDLTYAEGMGGYHNMQVDGESANPGRDDLLRLASKTDISRADAEQGLDQVRSALSDWPQVAASFGVAAPRVRDIGQRISTQVSALGPTLVSPTPKKRRPKGSY